jgi:hypothetical protein
LGVKKPPKAMPAEPLSLYHAERPSDRVETIRASPELAAGHFLSHVKQEPAIVILDATQEPAKLAQKTGFFSCAAPNDFVGVFALRKVGKLGRFFTVIEELVERDFQGASQFLECFNGRNGMAIFNARDIATEQSGALFDVPLGKLFVLAQNAKSVADNHVGIVS